MASLSPSPKFYETDSNGDPLASGLVYTYEADSSTPIVTYSDADGTQNTNPVVLDAAGRADIWLVSGQAYKFIVKTAAGATVYTVNDITTWDLSGSGGSADVGFIQAGTGAAATDMQTQGRLLVNVEQFGVVANSAGAASANTTALRKLISPTVDGGTVTYTGTVRFAKGQTYYFNDVVTLRDGIHLDLNDATLTFTKTPVASDLYAGFLYGQRDFSIKNGTLVGVVSTNPISMIQIGNRGDDGAYFQDSWDSLLADYQGNAEISNVVIISNAPAGYGINMIGGLRNVLLENIEIDGQDALYFGITYEFGWATDEAAAADRQTSHANNIHLRNIVVRDTAAADGIGVGFAGAYNVTLDNARVTGGLQGLYFGPGESCFFRPWADEDDVGVKRTNIIRNAVIDTTGTGITLVGAVLASGTYLSGEGLTDAQQLDLGYFEVDGFSIKSTSAGFGISLTGSAILRNGYVTGAQRGVFCNPDNIFIGMEFVEITACTNMGVYLSTGTPTVGTQRSRTGYIRGCNIYGNSTAAAGTYGGIHLDTKGVGIVIENNTFGVASEATQGEAVKILTGTSGTRLRGNNVLGHQGSYAYTHQSTTDALGNIIESAIGLGAFSGAWAAATIHSSVLAAPLYKQEFTLVLTNTAGTIQHRILGSSLTGGTSQYAGRITGASSTLANTPTVGAGTDFTSGVGLTSTDGRICFNTAAQQAVEFFGQAVIEFYDGGVTEPTAAVGVVSRDVNGTTRSRIEIQLYTPLTGALWAIDTTRLTAGDFLHIRFSGFIA